MAPILLEGRDVQPAQLFEVKPYSAIPNTRGIKYESYNFDASGYKWKLILYPYGDNTCPGNGHISLYLELLESDKRTGDWSVCVDLKFFVYNPNTRKYLTIQDAKGAVKTFNKKNTKQGFNQLLSVDKLNSGYLVNDCCTFGVEIFVIKPSSRGPKQTLTLVKGSVNPPQAHVVIQGPNGNNSYCWQINKFKELGLNRIIKNFDAGGLKWELLIDPKGTNLENIRGKYLSLYLTPKSTSRKVDIAGRLAVMDHNGSKKVEKTLSHGFKAHTKENWGYRDFMPLSDIYDKGYLKDGSLTVQIKFDKITIST